MEFLYIIVALIAVSVVTYFLMQRFNFSEKKQIPTVKIETFRVKGTARGAIGRVQTSEMLESRRRKVNGTRSKF